MKKHLIAALCIAALSSNKSFAQFVTPPSITTNTANTATGGSVGIGTATPAAKLNVFGTTNQLRLSNSSTIYSDINSTTNGLVFLPSSNANKVAFGISAPASGNGFHSNMGRFLMTDQAAPWPRGIIFQPNQTVGGDMPAGASITSGITAANGGEGLSLAPCAYGYNGVKLGAYAFNSSSNGGGWKSVWETQNVNISWGYPSLLLMKNGGNVGIGTGTNVLQSHLDIANTTLGSTAGNKVEWIQTSGSSGMNADYLKIYHNRYANGNNWYSSEIKIQKKVDATDQHYISFRGAPSDRSTLNFGFGTTDLMSISDVGQVTIKAPVSTNNYFVINDVSGTPLETFAIAGNGYTQIKVANPTAMVNVFDIYDVQNSKTQFRIKSNGNVYAREVEIQTGTFPDYVFSQDYKRLTLPELETYINNNKHLPNFENAEHYVANGIKSSEMFVKQQEKIEELTLYIIELEKRLKAIEEYNKK